MNVGIIISGNRRLCEELSGSVSPTVSLREAAGPEAVWPLLHEPLNLLFLEIPCPGTDPYLLLERINTERPDVPVIALVAQPDPPLVEELLRRGVYDVIPLPPDRHRLRIAVNHALAWNTLSRKNLFLREQAGERTENLPVPGTDEEKKGSLHVEAFHRLSETFLYLLDEQRFISSLVQAMRDIFGLSRIALFLAENGGYVLRSSSGWNDAGTETLSFRRGEGLGAWLEREQRILNLEETTFPSKKDSWELHRDMQQARAKICVPLFSRGGINGFLSFGNKISGRRFNNEELEFFCFLANYLGLIIDNAALYRQGSVKQREQEMILKHLSAGIIAVDNDGTVRSCNEKAAEILGLSIEDIRGKNILKAGSQIADPVERTLRSHAGTHPLRLTYLPTKKPLQISTNLIRDEHDQISGAVAIVADMSALESLEQKVRDLERLNFWHQLAASMAHQIKNPLVSIKTFVQLLPEKHDNREFREQFFRIVSEEVERLNAMVNDLFDFAEPGMMAIAPTDLSSLLDETLSKFRAAAPKIDVVRSYPEQMEIPLDTRKMERALDCIFENIREAIKEQGTCSVEVHAAPGNGKELIRIDIRDTGAGIAQENLGRVFSPFFTTKIKGMGLGLPIARRIVEEHGGSIVVENGGNGGTVCRIFLPTGRNSHE